MLKHVLTFLLLSGVIFSCGNGKEELTFWIGGSPDEINFWQEIIESYEQESGREVTMVRQPTYTDQRRQSLVVSLTAGQPNPDVFLMDVVWLKQFAQSDWLEVLDPHIDRTGFSIDPFYKRILDLTDRYNGKLYALPVFVDIGLFYYRTDLLEKHGFPGPPETWEQLVDYSLQVQNAEREKNPGFYGYVWQGAQYEGLVCTFLEFISSNGGSIRDDEGFDISSEANIRALQFMQDLIHKHRISPLNTYTEMKEEEVRRAFQRGNALFERNWLYAWNLHQSDGSPVQGKTGMTSLPAFSGNPYASALGGWHVGISAYSDVREEAWDLMRHILSYEIQKKLVLEVGWYPGRKDIYQDQEILEKLPHVEKLQEIFQHTVNRPNLAYYTQVSDVIQRFVNRCLAGRLEPDEALREIQTEIRQIHEIYGK